MIGWLQVLATFLGIAIVWLFYSSMVMRLVWLPSIRDSMLPLILGVAEFVLADMLQPEYRHLWFYVIAGVFALSTWTSSSTFRVARRDPRNRAFFTDFKEETTGSLAIPIVFVSTLVGLGLMVQTWGPEGRVGLVSMTGVNVILIAQLLVIRNYWYRSLADEAP